LIRDNEEIASFGFNYVRGTGGFKSNCAFADPQTFVVA
jgi:hypothetical protein